MRKRYTTTPIDDEIFFDTRSGAISNHFWSFHALLSTGRLDACGSPHSLRAPKRSTDWRRHRRPTLLHRALGIAQVISAASCWKRAPTCRTPV